MDTDNHGHAYLSSHAPLRTDMNARVAELEHKLAARDKTIAVLKKRVLARDESAASPLAVLEQNIALGKVVALKTRELSDDRRELEDTLAELGKTQAMLLQAQKMESIGQLAAGIAHEINTPTQYVYDNVTFVRKAIGMLGDVLRKAVRVAEAARQQGMTGDELAAFDAAYKPQELDYLLQEMPDALTQSVEGLDRISKIVAAMKEFSHPSAGEKEPVDLRALINTAITVCRNEWKYVAKLHTQFDDDVPYVACLRDEIGQVVLNLIVNAAHAISDTLEHGKKEIGSIVVGLRRFGANEVDIRITDNGAGIPASIHNKLFDPFFTTKGVGKGTGQGLAIAYSTVVDKHQGEIFFETELGVGTTFVVRLPIESPHEG